MVKKLSRGHPRSDWLSIILKTASLRSFADDELNDRIMKRSASPYAMLERYMQALRKAQLLRTPQERDLGSAIYGTTDDINGGILNYQW